MRRMGRDGMGQPSPATCAMSCSGLCPACSQRPPSIPAALCYGKLPSRGDPAEEGSALQKAPRYGGACAGESPH